MICFEEKPMKMKYAVMFSMLALAGCSGESNLPDPSAAQAQAAQQAYDDIREQKFDALMLQLEPELQNYFNQNQRELRKFSRNLPKVDYKTKKIVSKNLHEATDKQKARYTVTYEYAYDKNLIQYDVSFDQADGSSKIRDLNVSVFGESTK